MSFAKVEDAIEDIRQGKMLVVVDDEDRENEGDLIIAADKVTPEAVNFMATYAKGLICTPMEGDRLDDLDIAPMVANNTDNHETAFTVSVDAVTTDTGISAFERCQTVRLLIDPSAKPSSFRRPGHVFPLRAVPGGVLRRAGHTETTVDLAKLAGLYPAGLCCEIMAEDGHMMRTPQLLEFAEAHKLKMITVQDLIAYRKRTETFIRQVADVDFPSKYGHFRIKAYESTLDGKCHLAVVKARPFRVPDRRRPRLDALRLRRPARDGPAADRSGRGRRRALHAAGGARHRSREQDARLCAPGSGQGHGGGERSIRLRA